MEVNGRRVIRKMERLVLWPKDLFKRLLEAKVVSGTGAAFEDFLKLVFGARVVNKTKQSLTYYRVEEHFVGDNVFDAGGGVKFGPDEMVRIKRHAYMNENVNYFVYSSNFDRRCQISKYKVYSQREICISEDDLLKVPPGERIGVEPVTEEMISLPV